MSEVINLPQLGFDMREGTFLNWIKQVGETVTTGETLAEIESDKATIEVLAPASGVLLQTLVNAGDVVAVGAPIAMIGAAGEKVAEGAATSPSATASSATSAGNTANTGNTADQTPPAQPNALTTEKAEAPAPLETSNGKSAASVPAPTANSANTGSTSAEDGTLPGGVKASPLARKMAEDRHVDLRQVQGSGPNGRIVKLDVETYKAPAQSPAVITMPVTSAPAVQTAPAARPPAPTPSGPGIQEIPLTRLRQRIASRMVESKQTIPHFYVTSEVDMAAVLTLRKQINESLQETHKVSVNDIVIKAVALTLRQFPNLNSHFYGDKVIRYEHINIGIAVAMDGGGLMNVVAKDADTTPISAMAARNKEMIAGARSGKVKPVDVEGSTFTVSNLGAYEVENFIAIINPPEAGILAVGSAMQVPVVVNGELKIGTRMKCTLSVDHRVSDGAEGAQFMQAFKKLLEAPMRLLI